MHLYIKSVVVFIFRRTLAYPTIHDTVGYRNTMMNKSRASIIGRDSNVLAPRTGLGQDQLAATFIHAASLLPSEALNFEVSYGEVQLVRGMIFVKGVTDS